MVVIIYKYCYTKEDKKYTLKVWGGLQLDILEEMRYQGNLSHF